MVSSSSAISAMEMLRVKDRRSSCSFRPSTLCFPTALQQCRQLLFFLLHLSAAPSLRTVPHLGNYPGPAACCARYACR